MFSTFWDVSRGVWQIGKDISKEPAASAVTVLPEDTSSRYLGNVCAYIPNYMVPGAI